MPLEPTPSGLLARAGEYEPLRAFSQGGRYWDRVPQQLIREGGLAEFLPPVEVEEDDRGKYGRFHEDAGGKELLGRSKPLGRRPVPAAQLERLNLAIEGFRLKAKVQGVQPQNLDLIERFKLPDFAQDPELYRLVGPWWNRRLRIVWGCERTAGSSLPAAVAVGRLPASRSWGLRRVLSALLLLLLLLAAGWWLCQHPPRLLRPLRAGANQTGTRAKAREAAEAAAAAAKADQDAQRAQAAADQAKANATAARKNAEQAKAASEAAAANAADEIVLAGQDQPEADGTVNVTLEVRTRAKPPRAVPVESWRIGDQTISSQDRLQARLQPGDHAVKAVIRDAAGHSAEIAATVTIEPGRVIAMPGKVRVKQK